MTKENPTDKKAGLAEFKAKQREGTAGETTPEAVAVETSAPQVKRVTVKCLDNGSFRVGPNWYALSKGKTAVLPEEVAALFRKNKLVE